MITPVRDEELYIRGTIEAVLHQTIRPIEWIIVDDGSTDATYALVDRYTHEHTWIRALRRKDRGYRSTGGGIEAFLDAYPMLQTRDWEYLVNLDGDITFAPDYFEKCFEYFHNMPQLGIGGGKVYRKIGFHLRWERNPYFHVRGATKIYRRACWESLGGLHRGLGWDTLDELKANQLGWSTRTFPDLMLVHQHATGTAWGWWGNAVNDGEADYVVGYHPVFFGLKCVRNVLDFPFLLRSLGVAYGFLRSAVRRAPRSRDQALRSYLRKQQLRRLLGLSSIWK
ncbi:MAG TPA: glycosyltransferase family A protein [Candidatus Dormibacteraeota bacterium]|nr:glycosyltransferase family A protein [Candidatus Dormibacteraeota bacterium]